MNIIEIWKNYFLSFNGKEEGFLRRKLMAFAGVWTAAAISWKTVILKPETGTYIITIWLLFALVCVGLVTIEQIIKLKNEGDKTT